MPLNAVEACSECGRPLERADDFWYCDNPDCPRRPAARAQLEPEAGSDSVATGDETAPSSKTAGRAAK